MNNLTADCFVDIDETSLSDIVGIDTTIKFKLVGLKTIITRYCSPKRMFKLEAFLLIKSYGHQNFLCNPFRCNINFYANGLKKISCRYFCNW